MIKGGYILQPRSIDGSQTANMPPVTRELWLYLLRKVNHKDSGQFKRGDGFFSLSDIQQDLCWFAGYRKMVYSKPQLTKSLRRLNESNMTATTKATRGVIVSVCNYDYYQDPANYGGNDGGSTKEPRKKSSGRTINNNVKNERMKEFETLWSLYPKKDGRKEALRHFNTSVKTDQDLSDIQTALKNYIAEIARTGQYAKNGSTWFNNWQDWTDYEPQPLRGDNKTIAEQVAATQHKPEGQIIHEY